MSVEVSLFSTILLSMKLLSELQLLELQRGAQLEVAARYQGQKPIDPTHDYETTAQVALAELRIRPLNYDRIQRSLPALNNAELSLVDIALHCYLRCGDISDGATATEWQKGGHRGLSSMIPGQGPRTKEDTSVEARGKRAAIFRTVKHAYDAGDREKALALLDEYIQLREHANQPALGLKLHREFLFFHQPGNYDAIILLCEQSLGTNARTGNLFGQLMALETMAFAALRMGQTQGAVSYVDQLERVAVASPDDIARMTFYLAQDSDAQTLALLQARLKSAQQLHNLISQ